ncbi:MAG: TRAP transporter substrate-binding protein [Bacillota bacterium]|nr:TRAP transporter substrate-binding protein [Bacillota bacterium]
MKVKLFLLVMGTILLVLSGCGADQPDAGVEEEIVGEEGIIDDGRVYEFALAHFFPAVHPGETELVQGWADALNEASNGRIIITSYPGETLLKSAEIYEGVVSGIADIGLSAFFYTRGRFPVLEAFELPGIIYESSYAASKVAWEGIKELNPQEVQDTKLMFVLATGPGDLFTTKPVRSLSDLQGMKIRAAGLSADTLALLGASPEAMPQPEAYEALARGIVEGNLAPVEVLQGWRHAEVTDYLTRTPFLYNAVFFVTMNQQKWDELPPDLQEIVLEVNELFFEQVAAGLWDVQNDRALEWAIEETGQEVFTLTEEEMQLWIDKIAPIQEDFVERMNQLGFEGEVILETVKHLSNRY